MERKKSSGSVCCWRISFISSLEKHSWNVSHHQPLPFRCTEMWIIIIRYRTSLNLIGDGSTMTYLKVWCWNRKSLCTSWWNFVPKDKINAQPPISIKIPSSFLQWSDYEDVQRIRCFFLHSILRCNSSDRCTSTSLPFFSFYT